MRLVRANEDSAPTVYFVAYSESLPVSGDGPQSNQDAFRGLTNVLGSIGTAYGHLGNHEDGHRLLEAALRLAEDIEHHAGVVYSLINLGWLCRIAGRLDESLQWLRAALARIQSGEGQVSLAYVYAELGHTHLARGELDPAEDCYRRALAMPAIRPDVRNDCTTGLEDIDRLRNPPDHGKTKKPIPPRTPNPRPGGKGPGSRRRRPRPSGGSGTSRTR